MIMMIETLNDDALEYDVALEYDIIETGISNGSFLGFQGPDCTLWVTVFLLCTTKSCYIPILFVMHHQNIVMCQCITKKKTDALKKPVGALRKKKTGT